MHADELETMVKPPVIMHTSICQSLRLWRSKQVTEDGSKYGFTLREERQIDEIDTLVKIYEYDKTKTPLFSFENSDENKVFTIGFRTPPPDKTGLPHILEHSVLGGSKAYPLKDPFVELSKGSLKTFLNAFTSLDRTLYPVASTHQEDFYNLVRVYLDSVLNPLLLEETFMLEGWHHQYNKETDSLSYSGVVFNEMKGVFSNPETLLFYDVIVQLFPDTPYRLNPHGIPESIVDLTYKQFCDYYNKYYHPSNSLLYFYGDDPIERRFEIANEYLENYEYLEVDATIGTQPRFSAPKRSELEYDAGNADAESLAKRSIVSLSWLIGERVDPLETLALSVLDQVLIGSPYSPLRKSLLDSGLGDGIAGSGLSSWIRESYFTIGLKDTAEDSADKIESLILGTLKDLSENGLDTSVIEAAINSIEFLLREGNTGSYPRGLASLQACLSSWGYGRDPLEPLEFEKPLEELKKRLEKGEKILEQLIIDKLLNNNHRVLSVVKPSLTKGAEDAEAEKERLTKERSEMSTEQIESLIKSNERLAIHKEAPDKAEDIKKIPRLRVSDLRKEIESIPTTEENLSGVRVLSHDLPTDKILYLSAGFDMSAVPAHLVGYLPIVASAFFGLGTSKEDYTQFSQRIDRFTGGISCSPSIISKVGDDSYSRLFFVSAKATLERASELVSILKDGLSDCNFGNRERFKQIASQSRIGFERHILQSGHSVVNTRLRAHLSQSSSVSELFSGASQLQFLRELVQRIDEDWEGVEKDLKTIHSLIFRKQGALLNITVDEKYRNHYSSQIEDLVASLPDNAASSVDWGQQEYSRNEALTIPSQVNYVGKAIDLTKTGYEYHGSSILAVNLLSRSYLWDSVRRDGGAYGVFASYSLTSPIFAFASYRDPNLMKTLGAYDRAADFLENVNLSQHEMETAIIGGIDTLDSYLLPDSKGSLAMRRILIGLEPEKRQQIRDQVFSTSKEDFKRLGEALRSLKSEGEVVVLGPAKIIEDFDSREYSEVSHIAVI